MTPSTNNAFDHLAPPLQRWLWEQGWTGLREAQVAAVPVLLDGEADAVIAAATASGNCPQCAALLKAQLDHRPFLETEVFVFLSHRNTLPPDMCCTSDLRPSCFVLQRSMRCLHASRSVA